jgi:hypothetical protein
MKKTEEYRGLTQSDIDRPDPPRRPEPLAWLESCPGGWLTLVVFICFALGMWGIWLIWSMSEAVNTAVRG